jgi:hypothetical protein
MIVLSIATWALLEVLRHGSIFGGWRERTRLREDFWSDLIGCPFCFSHWIAGGLDFYFSALMTFEYWSTTSWSTLISYWLLWPIRVLVEVRAANWANDYFHSVNRTPGTKKELKNTFGRKEPDDQPPGSDGP